MSIFLVSALCHHLLRHYSSCGLPVEPHFHLKRIEIRRAIELINGRFEENLKLTEIAAAAHLSEYHFLRVFKEQLGVSPHQFMIRRRIERA